MGVRRRKGREEEKDDMAKRKLSEGRKGERKEGERERERKVIEIEE